MPALTRRALLAGTALTAIGADTAAAATPPAGKQRSGDLPLQDRLLRDSPRSMTASGTGRSPTNSSATRRSPKSSTHSTQPLCRTTNWRRRLRR